MKILVIGGGSIGRRHLRNLISLSYRELAVFEPNELGRRELAKLGYKTFDCLNKALDWQPQVAVIASPTDKHTEQAIQAARLGIHLFIEKPISHTMSALKSLSEEVAKRQLVTMVGCNMRFHHGPRHVEEELASVGNVLSIRLHCGSFLPRWRPHQDYRLSYSADCESGGAILDCIHEIDIALWLLGPGVMIAAAHIPAKSISLETDGLVEMLIQHHCGSLSSINLNYIERDYRRNYVIIGDKGTIEWDFGRGEVLVFGQDGNVAKKIKEPADWELNNMYVDEMKHFLHCVEVGEGTSNPVDNAIETLRVALEARGNNLWKTAAK